MDSYLQGLRLSKALGFLFVLIASWVLWIVMDPGKALSTQSQMATVTTVFEKAYLVTLPDGRQARIFRQGDHKAGTVLPVQVTTYENGETVVEPRYDDTP